MQSFKKKVLNYRSECITHSFLTPSNTGPWDLAHNYDTARQTQTGTGTILKLHAVVHSCNKNT